MTTEKKELKCPNCGSPAVRKEDGSCVCTNKGCGGTFTFQEGEARLADVGEIEKLQGEVDELKDRQAEIDALLGKDDPPADDEQDDQDQGDGEPDDDDDDEEDW